MLARAALAAVLVSLGIVCWMAMDDSDLTRKECE